MMRRLDRVFPGMWGVLCALFWLAGPAPAEAGLSVWTPGQPNGGPDFFWAAAVDPGTPSTLYAATSHTPSAGSPGRQVFKSTDGGSTWVERPVPGNRAIRSLAVDPLALGTIYAGAFGQTGLAAEVFKSTDGGDTWASMGNGLPGAGAPVSIIVLTVHPHIPGTVFASTGGLFRSTDGAASWAFVDTGLAPPMPGSVPNAISAIVVDPSSPLVLYAGVGAAGFPGPGGGVLKSVDGGATWIDASSGLTGRRDVRTLVIDPSAPATLYAGGAFDAAAAFKTTDGGQSWTPLNIGSVLVLAIDPQVPTTLYAGAGNGGAVRSTDGGAIWSAFNPGLSPPLMGTFVMAISPSGACLHAAFGGGLWHLTTRPDPCDLSAPPPPPTTLVAAVLPNARAVQVGTPVTVNATVINAGSAPALQVGISLASLVPADFAYQLYDTSAFPPKLVGLPNTPVDIAACAPPAPCPLKDFVLFMTPRTPFGPTELAFNFQGTNTPPVTTLVGINTLLLLASATPTPDIVALAGTSTNDGIVYIPSSGFGFFVVATTNLGIADTITATVDVKAFDTGGNPVPVSILICETDPLSGACISPLGSTVTTFSPAGAQQAFAIFLTASASIPLVPATNRVFVRFHRSDSIIVGGTSVAVTAP